MTPTTRERGVYLLDEARELEVSVPFTRGEIQDLVGTLLTLAADRDFERRADEFTALAERLKPYGIYRLSPEDLRSSD